MASIEAVDGLVLIDQNRALAGNVTPGDLPGFPVTISRSSTDRLSGNLDVADPDMTAIEITASDVTLDLNGFKIQGPLDQCSGSLVPVWCSNPSFNGMGIKAVFDSAHAADNVTVLNGTVRAMGSNGVSLRFRSRVDRMNAFDNGSLGVEVRGGMITNTAASGNSHSTGSLNQILLVFGGLSVNNVCGGLSSC